MWEENSPSRYKMSLLRRFLTQFTWRIHPTSSRHVVGFCLFGIYNINTVVDIRFWHCQMTHKIHINIKGGRTVMARSPFLTSYLFLLTSELVRVPYIATPHSVPLGQRTRGCDGRQEGCESGQIDEVALYL